MPIPALVPKPGSSLESLATKNRVTDVGLAHLKGLIGLNLLSLGMDPDPVGAPAQITDAGLAHLKQLTNLRQLDLYRTRVTDAGLEHLKVLANLKKLNLDVDYGFVIQSQVTEEGISNLQDALPELQVTPTAKQLRRHTQDQLAAIGEVNELNPGHAEAIAAIKCLGGSFGQNHIRWPSRAASSRVLGLRLNGTHVTDAGLKQVKELTSLRWLTLNGTQVSDTGLEHLKKLGALQELYLINTDLIDTGLVHLKGLVDLQVLDLTDTKITGAGLEYLKGMTKLERLRLAGTQVTGEGVNRLQRALPDCRIVK